MKVLNLHLALAISGLLASTSHAASGSVTLRGPSLLHIDARNQIEPTDAGFGTTGAMRLQFRQKGEARKQSLDITASGLEPNAQVGLTAAIDSDDNVTTILALPSDSNGRVRASYLTKEPVDARHRLLAGS